MEHIYVSIKKVNDNHYIIDPLAGKTEVCDGFEGLIKALEKRFNIINSSVSNLVIDQTKQPTKSGYYWACEDIDKLDNDILMVYVSEQMLEQKKCSSLGVYFPFKHFSLFMGPLEKPNIC